MSLLMCITVFTFGAVLVRRKTLVFFSRTVTPSPFEPLLLAIPSLSLRA